MRMSLRTAFVKIRMSGKDRRLCSWIRKLKT